MGFRGAWALNNGAFKVLGEDNTIGSFRNSTAADYTAHITQEALSRRTGEMVAKSVGIPNLVDSSFNFRLTKEGAGFDTISSNTAHN